MDAAALEAMDAPRTFHYVFAHRTLALLAAEDAVVLLDALSSDGASLLRLHWKATCHTLGIEPQPSMAIGYGPGSPKMGAVALGYRGERTLSGFRVGFVQLPLALQVREAHFVAIAHRAGRTRYVAWERTLDGGARLAEWSLTPQGPRGRRIGPPHRATGLDDFAAALERWLGAPEPDQAPPTLVPRSRESRSRRLAKRAAESPTAAKQGRVTRPSDETAQGLRSRRLAKRAAESPTAAKQGRVTRPSHETAQGLRSRRLVAPPRQPIRPTPVVTWSDAALVGALLVAWTLMIVVITLL